MAEVNAQTTPVNDFDRRLLGEEVPALRGDGDPNNSWHSTFFQLLPTRVRMRVFPFTT